MKRKAKANGDLYRNEEKKITKANPDKALNPAQVTNPDINGENRKRGNSDQQGENVKGRNPDINGENTAFTTIASPSHARRTGAARVNGKLDDRLEAEMLGHISRGCTWKDSAELCGINRHTSTNWRGRGADYLENPDEHPEDWRYGLFVQRLDLAEQQCKARIIDKLLMCDDWRAWRFWLINRAGNEWHSEHVKTELSGPNGAPLQTGNPFVVNFSLTGPMEEVTFSTVDHRTPPEIARDGALADNRVPDPFSKPASFLTAPQQRKEG